MLLGNKVDCVGNVGCRNLSFVMKKC